MKGCCGGDIVIEWKPDYTSIIVYVFLYIHINIRTTERLQINFIVVVEEGGKIYPQALLC